MTDAAVVTGASRWTLPAPAVARAVGGVGLAVSVVGAAQDPAFTVGTIAFPLVGLVVLWHRPANRIGWLLLGIGALPALSPLASTWHPSNGALGELDHVLGKFTVLGMGLVPFLVLLFPSGALPSRRWLWPARIGGAAVGCLTVLEITRPEGGHGIAALDPVVRALYAPLTLVVVAFGLSALAGALVRLHRSTGDEREQLRWFVASACVFPSIMVLNGFAQGRSWQGLVLVAAFAVGLPALAAGIGVAVLKYRLYAIDIVINKALVFGALAGFFAIVWSLVVAGVGSVIGAQESSFGLSLVAAMLAALAFQPVKERAQRVANRLVYGTRLSPYEAVSTFAHRVSEYVSFEDVLPEIAEAAAVGVGADRTRVRLFLPGGGVESAAWPAADGAGSFDEVVAVMDGAERIGEIALAKRPGEAITSHDRELLTTIVREAALAMRSLRLTEELRQRLVDLQESRRRLVTAQDEERRRMERDIHDGAQQHLVAMKIKLGLARGLLGDDAELAPILDDLTEQAGDALTTLRDLARGLFPPALVEQGLAGAVRSHIAKSGLTTALTCDGVGRFDLETEANVYFIVREALQNCSKYAPGAAVRVELTTTGDTLGFAIADDGPGFDVATAKPGSGTQNMRDRVEALGGRLEVTSHTGKGTTIRGWVPVTAAATADL